LFLEFIRATQLNRKVASAEHITEFFRRAGGQTSQSAAAPKRTAPPATAAAASLVASGETMSVSLSLITPGWPEAILQEIQQHNLSKARIELPIEVVEAKLRTGKADFAWQQLATWILGCPAAVLGSPHGATTLSLPLSVVAPMFLKKRGGAAPQRQPVSDLGIPDVFATPGKPAAAETGSPAPVATAPAPVPSPAPAPAPATPAPRKPAANLAELFGEPGKKSWTPKELVQGVKRLPGVAGSLIALQDGLLVAHSMPADWKTEAMAAFLPQIFGRINQYGKELNTGDAKAVAITTEAGTLQVYLAGIVYLAALGEPGASLPLGDLQLVAGELSRRSQ
jgi:predicted regulator of Ras-like GTPase activity (Roadblock/LC7/MglB family)